MSPRKNPASTWPWPADTPVDRARRVAQMYRHVLTDENATRCAEVDERMRQLGQNWVVPHAEVYDDHDLLDTELAADYLHVQPRTIDEWKRRGLPCVHTPDGVRYRVVDLRQWQASRRRARR